MCQSIQHRQIKEINKDKLMRHEQKVARVAAGEEVGPGSEDNDSEAIARSFLMVGWHFDDDDDASSAPPLVKWVCVSPFVSFFVLMTKGGGKWWVLVFRGCWCVLRSQALCFSLLVAFSWLEILLFVFRLCGGEPLIYACETRALSLNIML